MSTSTGLYIVMATFNGGDYLREQFDSICAQSLRDWVFLVRDDGSCDDTVQIIREYVKRDPRIIAICDHLGNLGPTLCFGRLLEEAYNRGARYIACSDQDDYWSPEKLASGLCELRAIESAHGAAIPALIHTDLEVVTDDLECISPSFMHYTNIGDPASPPLAMLVVQNHVVGCTLMGNRALLAIALPIPATVRMHDWWLALCAKAVGTIRFLPSCSVRYRQHKNNTLGAAGFRHIYTIFSIKWWSRLAKRPRLHRSILLQIYHLVSRTTTGGSVLTHELENIWRSVNANTGMKRAVMAYRAGLRGQNWVTTTFFYLFLVLGRWELGLAPISGGSQGRYSA